MRTAYGRAGLALVLAVGVLASCSSGGGDSKSASRVPAPLTAAFASVAPVTDVTATSDRQADVMLDEAGLRAKLGADADAIYALLDKARDKASGAEPPPDYTKTARTKAAVTARPNEARLLTATGSLSTILEFSEQFAGMLDLLTSTPGRGGSLTYEWPPSPPSVEDDGTRTVSDTIEQSIGFDVSGSIVTAVFSGTHKQTVTDDKTHAVLAQATDTRTYHGEINICPDAGGLVPLTINAKIRVSTSAHTSTADSTLAIKGHTDDQAGLGSVDASYQNQSDWDGGSVDVDLTGMSLKPNGNHAFDPASLDLGQATGKIDTSGDAKAGIGWAMTDLVLNTNTAEPALTQAQNLWRHGRCVVVAAPDYSAETPIKTTEQDSVQHTEDVDTKSETKFAVTLKHRFGAPPAAPVDAALSGPDKIDPDHLDAAPGAMTYTAPGEEDKTATLTLTSTSKRGIGKLVLRFATKPKKLELTMNGTVTFGSSIVALVAHVHAAKAPFKPIGDGKYRATLPVTTNYSLAIAAPNCNSGSGSEGAGSLVFNATTSVGPDKKPAWKVFLDANRSKVHTVETVCGISFSDVQLSGEGGGLAGVIGSSAGIMTFPAEGGTVHVHKTFVDATFVGSVPK